MIGDEQDTWSIGMCVFKRVDVEQLYLVREAESVKLRDIWYTLYVIEVPSTKANHVPSTDITDDGCILHHLHEWWSCNSIYLTPCRNNRKVQDSCFRWSRIFSSKERHSHIIVYMISKYWKYNLLYPCSQWQHIHHNLLITIPSIVYLHSILEHTMIHLEE